MTTAAIVLGVTVVTLTTGLTSTMVAFGKHGQNNGAAWVNVEAGRPGLGQSAPKLSDRQIEARLRSLPGAELVTARALTTVRLAGYTQTAFANFYRGDTRMYDSEVVKGHWPHGLGEAAAAPAFLNQHGLAVGDRITLYLNGRQARVTIVGELIEGNPRAVESTERRRDLGMLKSIGMTPRQVTVMTVTSVAVPGAVGGLLGIPLGIAVHRMLVDHVGVAAFPESMKDVWHAPQLAVLPLAGVAIAVLGALIPARSAARLTIATVLHNE
ncbi:MULTISPECIES: FtsX-like permease family protein [Streptomyces]|uniref:ABC transporter permease n=1 Tax=Streptomyces luteosporeus TaxID=173856 RepID=A0ABP6GE08_9ACTN